MKSIKVIVLWALFRTFSNHLNIVKDCCWNATLLCWNIRQDRTIFFQKDGPPSSVRSDPGADNKTGFVRCVQSPSLGVHDNVLEDRRLFKTHDLSYC